MSKLRQSTINVIFSAMGYIIPMVVNLITTPLLLKQLGESAFGIQSVVAVIIGYMTFMDMGLDLPITKYLAEDRAKKDKVSENNLLNTTVQLYLFIGIIGLILTVGLSKWLATSVFKIPDTLLDQAIIVFRIAGIGFLGSVGMSWGRALTMGLQRLDITYSVSVLISATGTLLGLAVVYMGYGVIGYVSARTVITLFAGPIYFLISKRLLPAFHFHKGLHRPTIKRVSSFLGYGTLNRLVSNFASRIDQTLLGILISIAVAGIYSVPFLVVNSIGYMLSYMLSFIFPIASELDTLGQVDQLRSIFIRASKFLVTLCGLIFIPVLILGGSFLKLWVPTIASQATGVLQILCIAGYISTIATSISNNLTVGLGKIRQFVIYNSIRSVILAILCFLLIRKFGLTGAAWALLLTTFVDIIYYFIVLKYYIKIASILSFVREVYLQPLLLTIVVALITFGLRTFTDSWIGLVSVTGIIIILSIPIGFFVGAFSDTEKRALKEIYLMIRFPNRHQLNK